MADTGKRGYKGYLIVIIITVITLFVLKTGLGIVDSRTNKPEYCTSCHAMKFPAEEFKESKHYKSKVGILPNCVDCHIPKGSRSAKFKWVVRDSFAQITGPKSKEDFEKIRPELRKRVRDFMRQNDSATCRGCHVAEAMKSDNEDAMTAHKKMIEEKKTCIDCHFNLAHGKVEVKP
ncbi:MAG: NapC/NirT family cytochrome c [Deltaproteobacteria bacterium]|nr:NapC/NirT family cytochrome c [Deltaproteobacteria bacterium]